MSESLFTADRCLLTMSPRGCTKIGLPPSESFLRLAPSNPDGREERELALLLRVSTGPDCCGRKMLSVRMRHLSVTSALPVTDSFPLQLSLMGGISTCFET